MLLFFNTTNNYLQARWGFLPDPLWYVDLLYTPVKNTSFCFSCWNCGFGGVVSCLHLGGIGIILQAHTGHFSHWVVTLSAWKVLLQTVYWRGRSPLGACFLQAVGPAVPQCWCTCSLPCQLSCPRGLLPGCACVFTEACVRGRGGHLLPYVKLFCFSFSWRYAQDNLTVELGFSKSLIF